MDNKQLASTWIENNRGYTPSESNALKMARFLKNEDWTIQKLDFAWREAQKI